MRVYEGQKVITKGGNVATVAFVVHGKVYVYDRNGLPVQADIRCEAWGGEHDMRLENAA